LKMVEGNTIIAPVSFYFLIKVYFTMMEKYDEIAKIIANNTEAKRRQDMLASILTPIPIEEMRKATQISSISYLAEEAKRVQDMLASAIAKPYSFLAEEAKRVQDMLASAIAKPYSLSMEALKGLDSSTGLLTEKANLQNLFVRDSLRKILENQNVLSQYQDQIRQYNLLTLPTVRVTDSLARMAAVSQHYGASKVTTQLAFKASLAYQEFARQQFVRLEQDVSEVKERRIRIIDLAGELLDTSDTASEIGIAWSGEESQESPEPFPEFNLYTVLDEDISPIYDQNSSTDVEQAFSSAPSVQINKLGGGIVTLIHEINQFAQRNGVLKQEAIFKPTNESMYACFKIPTVVANYKESFAGIVDHLFFLVYEGSGDAKRLVGDEKGQVPPIFDKADPILDPLWKLKHLRLSFRHDFGHGEEKKIREKHQKVGDAYKNLIGRVTPRNPSEWTQAQLTLYKQLYDMLDQVWRELTK